MIGGKEDKASLDRTSWVETAGVGGPKSGSKLKPGFEDKEVPWRTTLIGQMTVDGRLRVEAAWALEGVV